MTNPLSKRLALVTGGAKGIGLAIVKRLCRDGVRVVVADVESPLEQLSTVKVYETDVSSEEAVVNLACQLDAEGGVDILVNNAGIRGPTAPVTEYPAADWEAVLGVNLTGPFLCCKAFTPVMQRRGWGRIINRASMAGKTPYPLRSAYAASKWGLIGLTLTLAQELGQHGITVNALCPGPIDNDAMRQVMEQRAKASEKSEEEIRAEYLARLAVPRLPSEDDVAHMASFLVSESAWSLTGQAIEVSSGYRA
jgi:NAD(P)-dependent dehydrogenase (short-subunit alcohol dehydrogenase family)